MKSQAFFSLLFCSAAAVLVGPAAAQGPAPPRKAVTIDDLMALKNVVEAQISPNGKQVLYVLSEPDLAESFYNSDIWLVSASGGAPLKLTNGPKRDDTPRWSPSGESIAFLSDRGGKPQIWLISPTGGEARQLTNSKSGAGAFHWSPDGKRIAVLVRDPDSEPEEKRKKERDDTLLVDRDTKNTHVHIVDVASKEMRQLTRGEFSVDDLSWSPDGTRIALSTRPTPKVPDLFKTDIYIVAVASGKMEPLVKRDGPDTYPRWSPDGKRIAFVSSEGRTDWIANWYLCVVPAAGGTPVALNRSFDEFTLHHWWAADSRSLYFYGWRGVTSQLFSVSVTTQQVRPVSTGERNHLSFSFSGDTGRMAFVSSDPLTPNEAYVSPVDRYAPVRLTRSNPQVEALALGKTETIRWKSRDGMEIEGLLVKPVGFTAGQRYPLLTYVHGGPSGRFGMSFTPQLDAPYPAQSEQYPIQAFAGQGYAVLLPNPRGSNGYGERFRMANVKDWGHGDYDDIMSGIDSLIGQGIADADRLGIMGWSYGGFMTSWIITQTDRFRAASLGAAMTNLESFYGQTDIPDYMEYFFGDVPWKAKGLYERSSPMSFAANLKTPTLIQHGERDERVPLSQTQELYAALKKRKVPVEYAVYPRQGHVVMEPKLQADVLRRNLEWFNRWLGPAPVSKAEAQPVK